MDPLTVLTAAAVVFTLTVVVVAVFLVRTLSQARRTAERLEAALVGVEPVLREAELALREYRELGTRLKNTTENADRVLARLEHTGSSAMNTTRSVLHTIGGPVSRAFAAWDGVKAGAQVLFRFLGRDRGAPGRVPAPPR